MLRRDSGATNEAATYAVQMEADGRTVPLLSHRCRALTLTPTLSPTLPLYPYTPYPSQVPLLSHRCLRLRCAHPECRKHALLMQRPPLDCDLCARPLQHPMRSFFEFAADMQTALQARVRVRVRLRLRGIEAFGH